MTPSQAPGSGIDTLYILSAGHSGSTLLNLILGSHSRAVAVSELTNLPANIVHNEPCTCGAKLHDCEFWKAVLREVEGTVGVSALKEPSALELGFIDAPSGSYRGSVAYRKLWLARRLLVYASMVSGVPLPRFMRATFDKGTANRIAVHAAVRKISGADIVIDASKEYLMGVATYQARPAQTRLIMLVRDGRAVFYSNLKRGFGHRFSLKAWLNYYGHALPVVRRAVPESHVLYVKYEDLVQTPQEQIRRVCEFAGLEFEPDMLNTESKPQHVTSGNNMRFRADKSIRLDTQWHRELKPEDRAFFEQRAGALNRQFGYE